MLVTSISKVWSTSVFRLQSVTSLTQCLLHLGQTILINSMIKKDHLGVEVTRVIPVLPACAAVDLMIISGGSVKKKLSFLGGNAAWEQNESPYFYK